MFSSSIIFFRLSYRISCFIILDFIRIAAVHVLFSFLLTVSNQLAVRNVGGLEPLLALCHSEHLKQRVYSIRILHKISVNRMFFVFLHTMLSFFLCRSNLDVSFFFFFSS